jgi:hypothetical protein|tara:strand:+ start:1204 stop:1431 length:228 start_codon:yes stop_codon:yes gene_type:complete
MKYIIVGLICMSCLFAEIGKYQVSTTVATSKKGKVYIVETIINTETGKVIKRKKIYLSKYKLPYKDNRGRVITEE